MSVRRSCDPINIKRIWDAIRQLNVNHITCDSAKLLKYMLKGDSCTQAQVELYIKQAVKDGLILPTRNNRTESSSQTYKITDQELPEFDGNDWYCFECHLAGNVQTCNKCFRVFHSDCTKSAKKKFENHKNKSATDSADVSMDMNLSNQSFNASTSDDSSIADVVYDENLCSICNIVNIDEPKLEKSEVNYLLKFVLRRVRAWLPNTITHTMAQEDRPNWLTDSELTWRANQLFFEHRDMSVLDVNLNAETYSSLTEFLADMLTIQHNVAIFHGIDSQEYQAAEFMIRDTIYDLTEIRNCPDCYRHSNEKINPNWFVLPCKMQHKLVWAKQKGYPYWPAKVIRETSTHSDVRFFGGKHERSILHKSFVKPITVSKESLKIKTSANFNRAYEELVHHQKILADPNELGKILSDVKKKRPSKTNVPPSPVKAKPQPVKRGRLGRSSSLSSNTSKTDKTAPEPKKAKQEEKKHEEKKQEEKQEEKKQEERKHEEYKPEETKEEKKAACSTISGNNVIDISDCEEEEVTNNDGQHSSFGFDDNEQVSSSTENCNMSMSIPGPQPEAAMQPLDQPYSDAVEEMRTKLEALQNKKDLIKCAMDCMQLEVSRITNNHNDYLKKIFESHNSQISETKKKQWCYNCEQDAIYHCCWNTAYCSQTCQQQHWQAEHKKVCRRKRQV